MQTLQNILSQEMVQKLGWTLIHFIWQGAVIALLCAIVLRLMRKSSSNLRYTTAFIAMAIMVAAPMVTIRMIHISVPGANPVLIKANNLQTIEPTKTIKVDLPQDTNIKPIASVKQSLKDRFAKTIETLLPQIVICWLIGVVVLSIWYLGGWTQLQRLRRQMTTPVSKEIKTKLNQLSKILGINKTIDVVQSVLVNVPTVIGHFKPVVLLPASTLTGLSGEQIEAILAHELAHIKRCDYLINILQTVVEILGFYHPAVWWVSNKIRQERENCCDDIAVQITGDEINYAQALATMEEIRFGVPELAVAATGGNLFERIKRLLGKDISNNEKAGWLPSAIVILLIAGLLIPMTLTLSSCNTQKIIKSEMNTKINQIDIDTATKADVVEVFGEPEKYMWGDEKKKTVEVLDKNNLPDRYIMIYPNDFRVFIANDHIIEFRFEGQSDYVFDDGLTVGSSIKKAFKVLGRPKKVVDGRKNEFSENTYFKNIDGKKGFGYYAVPKKNIRIWIADNEVKAIYVTRSNYSDNGPGRTLKDSELPKGSIIDANGYIVDNVDYPFVMDFYTKGTWKSVDFVRDIENFNPDKKHWIWGELFLREMTFKNDGKVICKNGPSTYEQKWTKGLVLGKTTASKYTIKTINNSQYMFFEWKSGDYTIRHMKPSYYVLKKVEDANQTKTDTEPNVVAENNFKPQVLISARIVSVPQNWPKLKEITVPNKFFTPEELKQILSEIENVQKAKILAAPMVLLNDGEEGLITTKGAEFKVKCDVRKSHLIYGEYNLKYSCKSGQVDFSRTITMPSNAAVAIAGEKICDGNELILIVQPKVLEAEHNSKTGVFEEKSSSNTADKSVIAVESKILFVNEKFIKSIKDANFVVDVNHGSVLNDDQRDLLLEMVRGSSDANLLTAPRVTIYDGEDAAIIVVKPIDYISDYNESSTGSLPKVENVRTGVKMNVMPKLIEKTDLITLALDFEYTDVEFEKKLYKEKYEYQIPNVNKTKMSSIVTVADGQTVLLGGQKIKAEGNLDTVLILATAQKTNEILPPPDCNGMTR
jgi:beta-lactamase regulating signal transducer with metallopeptidase domain